MGENSVSFFDHAPLRPLRIVQVVNVRWVNATAWYALFLSTLLREAGHEVRVLGLEGTDSFRQAEAWGLQPEAFALNSSNPFSLAASGRKLARLAREFAPHIVNCHRGESFFLWAFLKRYGNFALVRTRGDQRPPRAGYANRFFHAGVADAVIATSSGIAASLRATLHVPENRVHTIFGGVDTRRFFPDRNGRSKMRAALGLGENQTAIGLVGRFDAVKGQKKLLEAFAQLAGSNLRLVLAGFDTASCGGEDLRALARELGVEKKVLFPGRVDDIRALMNALDIGVVASIGSETIARVALEMMACGVPLISTRVGVMPDLLEAEALVPPGDAAAMSALLQRCVADKPFMAGVKKTQASRMQSLRETDFCEQTLAVYREAFARRREGRPS